MIVVIDVTTLSILTALLVRVVRKIVRHEASSAFVVYVVFYCLFVLPIAYDLFYRRPTYFEQPNFALTSSDTGTRAAYAAYVLFVGFILIFGRYKRSPRAATKVTFRQDSAWSGLTWFRTRERAGRTRGIALFWLSLGLVSPIGALILAPTPRLYETYGAFANGLITGRPLGYQAIMAA